MIRVKKFNAMDTRSLLLVSTGAESSHDTLQMLSRDDDGHQIYWLLKCPNSVSNVFMASQHLPGMSTGPVACVNCI